MSNQRARRVPSFQGNNRLKFTAEEQQAIRVAERAVGDRSQPRIVVGPPLRPRHRLTLAIILALGGFLFLGLFIAVVLNSIRSQERATGSEIQLDERVQPQTQSQTIPNDTTIEFQNHESISEVSPGIVPPEAVPQGEPFHELEHPGQLPRTSTALSLLVDKSGRVIFVNEMDATNPVKLDE